MPAAIMTIMARKQEIGAFSAAELKNRPSKKHIPGLLSYLGKVIVQDMPLVLQRFPDHPAGKLLQGHSAFGCAIAWPLCAAGS